MGEKNFLIPGAIVVAGVIIAGAVIYIGGGNRTAPNAPTPSASDTAAKKGASSPSAPIVESDDPVLGDANAPVTVVEFGDFQCPFCGKFFTETEPQIVNQYVKTGKVKFVYRDFAFLGDESQAAAEAASCANEQGKFWAYHNTLYNYLWNNYYAKGKSGENVGAFSSAHLAGFASDIGLDTARFSECVSAHRFKNEVDKDTADGRANGVGGTPSFFINGRFFEGALPFSQFQQAIDSALAGK